jgi:hypothetical protein
MDKRKVRRYQRGNQKPYIGGQTTQWSKEKIEDTNIRLLITPLVSSNFSFDHCVVCPPIYGF